MQDKPTDLMMVTYNRLEFTKRTLDSIFENTTKVEYPYNLIIVDNGSSDKTVEFLEDTLWKKTFEFNNFLKYKIIKNKENRGIAIARNQCLKASTANWLCTLDNDILLPKDWLEKCIGALEADKSFAAIGVNFEGTNYPDLKIGPHIIQYKAKGNLGTACMVFNKSLHMILGFFNYKDYSNFYGLEDSDVGMRIRVLGMRLGYIKENGTHLGEHETGPYREFKTKEHNTYLAKFNQNCRDYMNRKKPIYITFEDNE